MLQRQTLVQALATAVLCIASAIAQASPTGDRRDDNAQANEIAQWHTQMCTDRYAHQVGEMAYLEAKLSLTDSQRPLFASWKDTVLAGARTHSSECAARKHDAMHSESLLDREAHMHDMLQGRLAEMDAQRPSLTALYQSLTPEQKHVFDVPDHEGRHGFGPDGSAHDSGWHRQGDEHGRPE